MINVTSKLDQPPPKKKTNDQVNHLTQNAFKTPRQRRTKESSQNQSLVYGHHEVYANGGRMK
jgi:hypothetical protein